MGRKNLHREYELLAELRNNPRASIRELCERMGLKSPSHVHSLLRRLEDEGLIQRTPRLARSVEVGNRRRSKSEIKARRIARETGTRQTFREMPKQTRAQLQASIDRVVAKAKEREAAGVDVMHDYRRRMHFRAVKVG